MGGLSRIDHVQAHDEGSLPVRSEHLAVSGRVPNAVSFFTCLYDLSSSRDLRTHFQPYFDLFLAGFCGLKLWVLYLTTVRVPGLFWREPPDLFPVIVVATVCSANGSDIVVTEAPYQDVDSGSDHSGLLPCPVGFFFFDLTFLVSFGFCGEFEFLDLLLENAIGVPELGRAA